MTTYQLAINSERDVQGGYAALAGVDDGSFVVNGVALGNGDVTEGLSGKRTRWPGEVLADAEGQLTGAPITAGQLTDLHPGTEKTDAGVEVDNDIDPDTQVGTVTQDRYDEALGLMWQGRIDEEYSALGDHIEEGAVDVSPVLQRDISRAEDGGDMWEAEAINEVRDLTALPPNVNGAAPSNDISIGDMSTGDVEGTEALAATYGGHVSASDPQGQGAEDGDPPGDDPPEGASNGVGGSDSLHTMIDDLTDDEASLVMDARRTDNPTVVSGADAMALQDNEALIAEAEDINGEAKAVEVDSHEALTERVGTIADILGEALVEQRGLRESTVDAMGFEAMAAEFETDDGGIDMEALAQNPESEAVDDEDGEDGEALSEDVRESAAEALSTAKRMDTAAPGYAEEKRREAAEALALDGDADVEEIEEAL